MGNSGTDMKKAQHSFPANAQQIPEIAYVGEDNESNFSAHT